MPQVINIEEFKKPEKVSEKCKNSDEPVFVAKDGHIEMVAMSMELYNKTIGNKKRD